MSSTLNEQQAQALLSFATDGITIVIIIYLLLHIFHAFGLMKIAEKNHIKNKWLVWIPVVNSYIVGKIAFNNSTKKALLFLLVNSMYSTWIPFSSYSALQSTSSYPYANSTLSFISMIIIFIATYKIYKKMSDKAVIMIIFSILSCGLLIPIFTFAIRNNEVKE